MKTVNTERNDLREQELLRAVRLGDVGAFSRFFNLYWEDLYREAYYRLKNHDDAQDLVQEIFASCWQRRDSLRIQVSLKTYLMGALKHQIIRHITKRKIHENTVGYMLKQMTHIEENILDLIAAKEVQKTLEQTISYFPENMRQIILLRMQQFTVGEIAEALGLSPQTVKNNTTDALKRLKNVLTEQHPEISSTLYLAILLFTIN